MREKNIARSEEKGANLVIHLRQIPKERGPANGGTLGGKREGKWEEEEEMGQVGGWGV